MNIKKKLFLSLLAGFTAVNNVHAKDFYVSDITLFMAALHEAETNREDDIIYVASGVYEVSSPIVYRPNKDEHFSLTIKPEEPNGLVIFQRKVDIEILQADFSKVNGKAALILDSLYLGDYSSYYEKYNGLLSIDGNNLDVKILNCKFYGSFSNLKESNINLKLSNSMLEIKNSLFFRTASQIAGAFSLEGTNNNVLIEKNDFYSNKSIKGTIYFNVNDTNIIALNNRFNNNIVYYDNLDSKSGIALEGSRNNVYVLDNYFFGNISNSNGGSIYISGKDNYTSIIHNKFTYNYSKYGSGSSVYLDISDNSYAEVLNNTFTYNSSKYGGAINIDVKNASVFIGNNIFNQNHTFSDNPDNEFGGGVNINSIDSTVYFMNNTLYSNYTYGDGGGLSIFVDNKSNIKLLNNIFWENYSIKEDDDVIFDIYINSNISSNDNDVLNIETEIDIFNNIYSNLVAKNPSLLKLENNLVKVDPKLKNPEGWDFHLDNDSPCIDAGILPEDINIPSEFFKDIDDEPRVIGDSIDIGADEFSNDEENKEIKKVGRLIIQKDKSISTNGIKPNKIKLICLRYYTIKNVQKYMWDFNGDGNTDLETRVPFAEVDSFGFNPNKVYCYVQYLDGSIEKVN